MIRILLVEDEPASSDYLAEIVKHHLPEMSIEGAAENGLEALSILNQRPCDIVIADISMPVMDGLTLAKKMHENWPWLRCVLISGYQDFHYARDAISYGVSDYLVKPVRVKELVDTLSRLSMRIEYVKRINELVLHGGQTLEQQELLALENEIGHAMQNYSDILSLRNVLEGKLREFKVKIGDFTQNDPHFEDFLLMTAHMKDHLSQALTLRELSDKCAISQRTAARLLRKYARCTFVEYLTSLRIQRAKEIIFINPHLLIKDVAAQVGFCDPLYFSRVFRIIVGSSPSEYIKR